MDHASDYLLLIYHQVLAECLVSAVDESQEQAEWGKGSATSHWKSHQQDLQADRWTMGKMPSANTALSQSASSRPCDVIALRVENTLSRLQSATWCIRDGPSQCSDQLESGVLGAL